MLTESKTKRCSGCKQTKPHTDFYSDSSKPNGIKSRCIICYKQSHKDAEHIRQRRRKRYAEKIGRTPRPQTTHGLSKTRTYNIWNGMHRRCSYPGHASYSYYGGRGITVCDRWRQFENFLADMGEAPDALSLDRIDPNGNYEPSNCRWADKQTQVLNTRRNTAVNSQ